MASVEEDGSWSALFPNSRVDAHWHGIAPVLVVVSSGGE